MNIVYNITATTKAATGGKTSLPLSKGT